MKSRKSHKTFEGTTEFWSHDSKCTQTEMKFSTFLPQGEIKGALIWLSGLTCTDENFITKAGAQRALARENLMVICPDTSPRGLNLPNEHEADDFGSGASFYINATSPGYRDHYKMESYIVDELYGILKSHFQIKNVSIFGHSMGGHGALTLGLRHADLFKSISAFSPIVNPVEVPWGQKAFAGYLGDDRSAWREHDACELLKAGRKHPAKILIHQGLTDGFLETQLRPANFSQRATQAQQPYNVELCPGYDHSYYFISTFIDEHIKHHAEHLKG